MITCKESVRFAILRPYVYTILEKIDAVFIDNGYSCVITCGTEAHGGDDPHTNGFALDLRSKHIATSDEKHKILSDLRRLLGGIYTVILESEGENNEHFHAQVRKNLWRSLK